ncbi:hypothetical protein BKA62DRAFT_239435 [Auriculariales sp. MPI-PUGE-AT-0066]|nr:hypothetical protein BKA62DRAFT_239435 [Auriculariales sp. MPI-PUGE-AT-0066]
MLTLRRLISTTRPVLSRQPSLVRPGPPPLPAEDQREFEALVKAANDAPNTVHPDARSKPAATFEGDTNPVTGEVGGPKREPTTHGDWSYGGRATDF